MAPWIWDKSIMLEWLAKNVDFINQCCVATFPPFNMLDIHNYHVRLNITAWLALGSVFFWTMLWDLFVSFMCTWFIWRIFFCSLAVTEPTAYTCRKCRWCARRQSCWKVEGFRLWLAKQVQQEDCHQGSTMPQSHVCRWDIHASFLAL